MAALKGSQTHANLKAAFAGESQANRRYLYFAKQADIEGYPDTAGLFPRHGRGRDRPRPRAFGLSEGSGRSGHRSADWRYGVQPRIGHRRRDARIHGHVSGHGQERRARKASRRSPTGSRC